jgi:hypothetical protein
MSRLILDIKSATVIRQSGPDEVLLLTDTVSPMSTEDAHFRAASPDNRLRLKFEARPGTGEQYCKMILGIEKVTVINLRSI